MLEAVVKFTTAGMDKPGDSIWQPAICAAALSPLAERVVMTYCDKRRLVVSPSSMKLSPLGYDSSPRPA